jgi:hypothetical protein
MSVLSLDFSMIVWLDSLIRKKERKVREMLDSLTIDHGRKTTTRFPFVDARDWKPEEGCYCSGCLKRHDPQDCPHKG